MADKFSIIIPVYNEEKAIGEVIDEIRLVLDKNKLEIPIIVIDDGSTDRTAQIVQSKNVKIIRHESNRGYGASLKTGIRNCPSEFIIILDGDGTYPAYIIPDFIQSADSYDMVVGARDWSPTRRAFAKWFLRKLANYLAEYKIPDLNSGLRLIRKSVIERYWSILPEGFSFTTTITLALHCNGYEVKYKPIQYRKRNGISKIKPIRNTWEFILLIIRTVVYFNPLRVFLPIGIFMIILGTFIGFYSKFVLGELMDVTTVVAISSGIEIIIIGFLADLISKRSK